MSHDETVYYLQKSKAKKLSDLFAEIEGRRPRILIGSLKSFEIKEFRAICNTFADVGCNVDIAPNNSSFQQIAKQCQENDVDVLLIFTSDEIDKSQLDKLGDIVLSVYREQSNTKPLSLALKLLTKLLQVSD